MYDNVKAHLQKMLDIGGHLKVAQPMGQHCGPGQEEGWQPEVLYQPQEAE